MLKLKKSMETNTNMKINHRSFQKIQKIKKFKKKSMNSFNPENQKDNRSKMLSRIKEKFYPLIQMKRKLSMKLNVKKYLSMI